MKYRVVLTSQFKRDLRLIERQGRDMSKLERVIDLLASGAILPKSNRDHALRGNLKDLRECAAPLARSLPSFALQNSHI